jgi:hypothetical protein
MSTGVGLGPNGAYPLARARLQPNSMHPLWGTCQRNKYLGFYIDECSVLQLAGGYVLGPPAAGVSQHRAPPLWQLV